MSLLDQLTCAAHPRRLVTWSILFESLNQSTATSSMRCLPAGTFKIYTINDVGASQKVRWLIKIHIFQLSRNELITFDLS